MRRGLIRGCLSVPAALTLLVLALSGTPAETATITVTANAQDILNGSNGSCSLREAITNINDGTGTYNDCTATGTYGTNDEIILPAGTYTNNIAGADEDNNATGDLDILSPVTITGAGADVTFIDGGGIDRVLHISGVTVTISGVTIQNGNVTGAGGGIYNYNGTLTVTSSTISSNSASQNGGGIATIGRVPLTVTSSTILNNSAGVHGGGIYSIFSSSVTVTNSTISGNSAIGNAASTGGGIRNSTSSSLTVINSTITDNTAPPSSGGGINSGGPGASASLRNTIVASSSGGGQTGGDCSGTITDNGNNLDSDGTCNWTQSTSISNANPILGPLQYNGGPTWTHALITGSPAIDAGDPATCANSPVSGVDQRGVPRPQGPVCDIGAFEAIPPHIPVPTMTDWGMVIFLFLAGAGAVYMIRKGPYQTD